MSISNENAERPAGEVRESLGTQRHPPNQRARTRRADRIELTAEQELRVLSTLRAGLGAHHEALEDPDLMVVLAESETSLFEVIDLMLELDLADDTFIHALKAQRDTMAARLHRLQERRQSRRAIIEQTLCLIERKSLERPTGTLVLVDRAPALVVEEESQIPSRFFDMKPVLNRRLTKESIEAGEEVPGARLSNSTLTLTIRRR